MIDANETFEGTWPYQARFFEGGGFKHHFVDEGSRDSEETFVCVHGEPTWGYLYRNCIPRLSEIGRVIVPDHMGFGKSETPQDRGYTPREHYENLEGLLLDLDVRNVTLVMQDWGGPIASQFAYRHPDRIKRMVVMNTIVGGRPPAGVPSVVDYPWFKFVSSDAFEPVITNLSHTILSVLKRAGFEHTSHIDETWVRAFGSPFTTREECLGALRFPQFLAKPEPMQFIMEGQGMPGAMDAVKALPAMMVTGADDRALPCEFAVGCFRDMWPNAPVTVLPGVGHFIQEDAPEIACTLIAQFVQMTR